ncbi:MAG TPA: response regulator [Nitriliruptorales bacterium]|nr:response regulator [Nitriliruptorales bacterium]
MTDEGATRPATGEAPPSAEARRTRVLIAEDEALIRLDLKEMLEEEGFDVVAEVADGASAVRLTRELHPDLVILDVKMPVMDGIQAAEEIARDRLAAVLILTAFSQRDLVEKARRAGAMAYLVKPFQKHDLLPAVEIAAGRFREMSGLESQVDDLQGRLEARKVVEHAKGLLQDTEGMTEAEAFRWIQRQAMQRRVTMKTVAEQILSELGDGSGGA